MTQDTAKRILEIREAVNDLTPLDPDESYLWQSCQFLLDHVAELDKRIERDGKIKEHNYDAGS